MQLGATLRLIWNVAIILVVGWFLARIAPKVFAQFMLLAQKGGEYSPQAFVEVAWSGCEGFALIVLILLGAHSLSTWVWCGATPATRWIYGIVGLLFVMGSVVSVAIDLRRGFVFWGNYIGFLIAYALFAFPILAFGKAYPAFVPPLARALAPSPKRN